MALMERVSTLVRANLNDLIDKAEDPEKLLKQVLLDMQNQLMQLKTQVAIAIADQHLLEKKKNEYLAKADDWQRKAEMSVRKQDDALARAAIERKLAAEQMAENFNLQVSDQRVEAENLKAALRQLEAKMEEAQGRIDLLIAQHRRSRIISKANDLRSAAEGHSKVMAFDRMKRKVEKGEAVAKASGDVLSIEEESRLEERFAKLEQEDKIEMLLQEMKRRPLLES